VNEKGDGLGTASDARYVVHELGQRRIALLANVLELKNGPLPQFVVNHGNGKRRGLI